MADPIYPIGANGRDPLRRTVTKSGEQLCNEFSRLCDGMSHDQVISAGFNLIVRAIRQTYKTKAQAEAHYNELFGKNKHILLEGYDSVTGNRKQIFPFTQHLLPSLMKDKDKLRGGGR